MKVVRLQTARVLVLDNLDSFTYSLVQLLLLLGCEVTVVREKLPENAGSYDLLLLSPGPGRPEGHPALMQAVLQPPTALFGVCLGMQAIALAAGGEVGPAPRVVHGRTSQILHNGSGMFAGVHSPFRATRYHSLAVSGNLADIDAVAHARDGTIMALQHRTLPISGVQFHPESVRTEHGLTLMRNVLEALPAELRLPRKPQPGNSTAE